MAAVAPTQRGTIAGLHWIRQRGTIRGEDGRLHHFRREDMVSYLDFLDLKTGDPVTFEIDAPGSAFNVERAD